MQVVVNQNPKYFKKLATVMQKTDSRTVSNYLMWRAVASSMPYLNEEAREIRETFNKAVYGVNADPPRWKTCASKVGFNSFSDSSFRVVAGSMYIQVPHHIISHYTTLFHVFWRHSTRKSVEYLSVFITRDGY